MKVFRSRAVSGSSETTTPWSFPVGKYRIIASSKLEADPVLDGEEPGIWNALGRLNTLIGIGTSLLNLVLVIIEFMN